VAICFFGTRSAIDYHQIGGTENYVRRLAETLASRGDDTDYVMYDSAGRRDETVSPSITCRYFEGIKPALRFVRDRYDHVVTVYVYPRHRPLYHAVKRLDDATHHFVYFSWPSSPIKRAIYLNEQRIASPGGRLFCLSGRQYRYVKQWSDDACLLRPPVPESYFCTPDERAVGDRLRVRFIGRVDPEKGIQTVIDLFKRLNNERFDCSLHGIHHSDDQTAVRIHRSLQKQTAFTYVHRDREQFTPDIEKEVGDLLRETDIFVQPYKQMSSTIDAPLLVLEAMATLVPTLTVATPNLVELYGESPFLLSPDNTATDLVELVSRTSEADIINERKRLHNRVQSLDISQESTADRFLREIESSPS